MAAQQTGSILSLNATPVKHFLDSVDIVLNSNTFIVEFEIANNAIEKSLKDFLLSAGFIEQLTRQDSERGWNNLHYFDTESNSYKVKSGNLSEPVSSLLLENPKCDKREYLIGQNNLSIN